ncbi:MAG: hypothetical protein AXW17_05130 [Colwellia sp. Phe_37]|nr:MAG: hypothetical protein AXW17_05130 [Colwellia sp. Phe_37]
MTKIANIIYFLMIIPRFLRGHNAQIMGKKLLAKIATQEQKPTVFCPVNLLVICPFCRLIF